MTAAARRAAHRRPRTRERSNALLTGTGIAVALWLGLSAPSVSPASPSSATPVAATGTVPSAVTAAVSLHTGR